MRGPVHVALTLLAVLFAGCSEPEPKRDDLGCGEMPAVTFQAVDPPSGALVVDADSSIDSALGYARVLADLGPLALKEGAAPGESVDLAGYRVTAYADRTEVWLSPLEWVGLLHILDRQAVEQGAVSARPFDGVSYVLYVDVGDEVLQLSFGVYAC